jgi:hydroxypyruvate isomerase
MTHKLKYAVNCSILCTELPLLQRPAAATAAGFDAVEFWWPFADAVPGMRRSTGSSARSRTPGSAHRPELLLR